MKQLHWMEAQAIESKRGNPWIVTPTRAMLLGLEVKKVSKWKINGIQETVEVTYDYDYAVGWGKQKLGFLNGLPGEDRDIYLGKVFGTSQRSSNSTITKSKQSRRESKVEIP